MTHVVDTKVIQSLGDLNLLLGVKEGVGELFTFTKGTLNDLETRDIAQEVGHADVVAVRVAGHGRVGVLTGLDGSEAGVSIWREGDQSRIRYDISASRWKYQCHWLGRWRRWCAHWAHCLHRGTFCKLIAG